MVCETPLWFCIKSCNALARGQQLTLVFLFTLGEHAFMFSVCTSTNICLKAIEIIFCRYIKCILRCKRDGGKYQCKSSEKCCEQSGNMKCRYFGGNFISLHYYVQRIKSVFGSNQVSFVGVQRCSLLLIFCEIIDKYRYFCHLCFMYLGLCLSF